MNCRLRMRTLSDHDSYKHNFSSWQKIQSWMGFKPVTSAILMQCSTNKAITTVKVVYIIAMITEAFISFSLDTFQIYSQSFICSMYSSPYIIIIMTSLDSSVSWALHLYMLWFKFTSRSNVFKLVHIFQTGSYFVKPVYIFQTGSYFSNWVEIFKPV